MPSRTPTLRPSPRPTIAPTPPRPTLRPSPRPTAAAPTFAPSPIPYVVTGGLSFSGVSLAEALEAEAVFVAAVAILCGVDEAAVRQANARLARTVAQPRAIPEPHELGAHALGESVRGPLARLLALQAQPGSLADRFGGFLTRFNALRDKWNALDEARQARQAQFEAAREARRLSAPARASDVYDFLERSAAERARRRLGEQTETAVRSQVLELPPTHALAWLHDLVDWEALGASASHLYDVERRRMKARAEGHAPAEAARRHPTGWSWLDDPVYTQPTAMGDALRRLWHRKRERREPEWHQPSTRARIGERAAHPEHGHARRLAEGFLEGTLAAPFSLYDELLASGTYVPQSKGSFWEASLRYIVGSTVGCYFAAPVEDVSRTQGGDKPGETEDGEKLKILRPSAEKMCFPACARTALEPPEGVFASDAPFASAWQGRLSSRSSAPSACSPAPSASTSRRSRTTTTAWTTAPPTRSRARSTTSTSAGTMRSRRTRSSRTRPCCASPRASTPSRTRSSRRRSRTPTPPRGRFCVRSANSGGSSTRSSSSSSPSVSWASYRW